MGNRSRLTVVTPSRWPAVVPAHLNLAAAGWIGLSGVVGLAVGDSALFRSFTLIGPRRGMMMMAAALFFTVVVAWILLDKQLGAVILAGMAAVIAGVLLAVGGRDPGGGRFRNLPRTVLRTGFLLALVGAAGQGLGSAFAKLGMIGGSGADPVAVAADPQGIDPLEATLVRMTAAAVVYWLAVLQRHRLSDLLRPLRDRRGTVALAVAIFMDPYASVWISVIAIKHASAGVAQALLGLVPIFVILPAWLVYRDRPAPMSLVGVALAVGGGVLLFLR